MSDLVGNPDDRFSDVAAHLVPSIQSLKNDSKDYLHEEIIGDLRLVAEAGPQVVLVHQVE